MFDKPKTVSILAIGTEITSGEIVNTNSVWLAQRLDELGFETRWHIAVSDEPEDIVKTLEMCSSSDVILCTGGLGPTTDDRTRETLAKWLGQELEFNQDSFDYVKEYLAKFGRKTLEGHKHQCYFPKDCEILDNKSGTARGFVAKTGNGILASLPGPPNEVESVWELGLKQNLKQMGSTKAKELVQLRYFGIGESEVAEVAEQLFAETSVELGYRATYPYILLKLWIPNLFLDQKDSYLSMLQASLGEYYLKDDPLNLAMQGLKHPLTIFDRASEGIIASRIDSYYVEKQKQKSKDLPEVSILSGYGMSSGSSTESPGNQQGLCLSVLPDGEKSWCIDISQNNKQLLKKTVEYRGRGALNGKRARKYIAEMSFQSLAEVFSAR